MSMQLKMDTLCDIEGITEEDDFGRIMVDSVSPGICMNDDCDYSTEVEPDQRVGWCEECQDGTVMALTEMVMEGILPTEKD